MPAGLRLVTAAGANLMQLNDIAKGVADKDLIGILSYQPLNLPVPDPTLIEFAPGLPDVLHCQGHMWYRRIFDIAARHRPAFSAHQVDLRGVLVIPDIEPEARNARDIGPARVSLESQQVRVNSWALDTSSALLPMRIPW